MRLNPISSPIGIANAAIRDRVTQSSVTADTQRYLAFERGVEVAFLSIDVRPSAKYLVLYELFVPSQYRGVGIGTRLLDHVNQLAKHLGCEFVVTRPQAFEDSKFQDRLVQWYKRNGYATRPERPSELERKVGVD